MRLARSILAFAIAASLALLPVGASAAGMAMSGGDAHAGMEIGTSEGMSMDCCPDDIKGGPVQEDGGKCPMGFCCTVAIVAMGRFADARFELLATAADKAAIPDDQVVSPRSTSPPFRPPRV